MERPLNSKLLLLEIWEETIEVILPNLHHRHTGVTSTVSRLLPILEKSPVIASTGATLSKQGKSIPLWKPLFFQEKKMGQKVRRHTQTNFNINIEAAALTRVYQDLMTK